MRSGQEDTLQIAGAKALAVRKLKIRFQPTPGLGPAARGLARIALVRGEWYRRPSARNTVGVRGHSSIFSAEMNASCGISTLPNWRIFFLPAFCFSRSFFFRVASPP